MVDAVIKIFESNATSFATNGIGYLPDAIDCTVVEERNGEFELSMTYPITGKRYSELQNRRILVAKSNPFSNPQPFRIYEITKPLKGKVSVYAEHISYDLSGIPVKPFSAGNIQEALVGLKKNALSYCPFTFSSDKTTVAVYNRKVPNSIRSELAGVEGSILDVYRGEYEFDQYSVKLWNNRGLDRGVTIRYGKNMIDLEQTDNVAKLYSGVLPYWYSDMDENGGLVQGTVIPVPGVISFTKILVLDCSYDFQERPTIEQLTNFATNYITTSGIGTIKSSTTVSFIDLSESKEYENLAQLSKVHLCDTVTVEYMDLGVKVTAKCVKTKYNVLENRYDSIELGEAKSTLADTLAASNRNLAEEFEKKLLNTSGADTEEFKKNLNAVYDELSGNIKDVSDELSGNIKDVSDASAKGDKKLAADMEEFNDNLEQLITSTVENEAMKREMAIAHATDMITGNLGGYVILHSSTNADYPDEILIMDSLNIETAQKIWRWNKSGLGYSNTGYNGSYTLAMTQDGTFVADFIKSGNLDASLITTGFMSANLIKGGTLVLGGINDIRGQMEVLNEFGEIDGTWSSKGITMRKSNITIYGTQNDSNGIPVDYKSIFTGLGWRISVNDDIGIRLGNLGAEVGKSLGFGIGTKWGILGFGGLNPSTGAFVPYYRLRIEDGASGANGYNERHIFRDDVRIYKGIYLNSYIQHMYSIGLFPHKPDEPGWNWLELIISANVTYFKTCGDEGYGLNEASPIYAASFNTDSSLRYKENIEPMSEEEARKILKVEAVTFDYINKRNGVDQRGVIAEDVYQQIPYAVTLDNECRPNGVDYAKFTPYLIKMVQIQEKRIEDLEKQLVEIRKGY